MFIVYLGCSCNGSCGWAEWIDAASAGDAVSSIINIVPVCCRCGELIAQCENVSDKKKVENV